MLFDGKSWSRSQRVNLGWRIIVARNKYGVIVNTEGTMMMSRNHVVLLLTLAAQPEQTVLSKAAWARACQPVCDLLGLELNQGNLRKAIDRFPWYLAEWKRTGRGIRVSLSDSGKEVVEQMIRGETTVLVRDFYRMERPAEAFRPSKELATRTSVDCDG
jgi:hypothetical protein